MSCELLPRLSPEGKKKKRGGGVEKENKLARGKNMFGVLSSFVRLF